MKVLHITYDMRIGGTEMVIKSLVEHALISPYQMAIYCIESPLGPWGESLSEQQGVLVECDGRNPGFDFGLIKRLRAFIKTHQFDVVHCHQYTPWVYGAMACLGVRSKVIFTEHGRFYPDSSSWKRRVVNPLLQAITACVTAISNSTRLALQDYEFLNAGRIKLVYNGISPLVSNAQAKESKALFGISEDAIVLGTIARFDPIKNHLMMLEAFAQVRQSVPNAVLVIVGDGDERPRIEEKINVLALNDSVILTGYMPAPADYLAMMDIFLLSSLSEGTSMTLLEAMSLSKPCVVTDAGGNSEIIQNGVNGRVTANDNSKDFAQAIIDTIDNDKIAEYGQNGKVIFDTKFHVNQMAKQYFDIYESLAW